MTDNNTERRIPYIDHSGVYMKRETDLHNKERVLKNILRLNSDLISKNDSLEERVEELEKRLLYTFIAGSILFLTLLFM